jgi:hypothetical protein
VKFHSGAEQIVTRMIYLKECSNSARNNQSKSAKQPIVQDPGKETSSEEI